MTDENASFDRDAWRDQLSEEVPPDQDGLFSERRAKEILKMYDHLREHGELGNDHLASLASPDIVKCRTPETFWASVVKGTDTLRALPGVISPKPGTGDPWEYRPLAGEGRKMSANVSVCAMCCVAEPYGGYQLPAPCVRLLDGGDNVDPSAIDGEVAVELCEECTHVARRMARDDETSPLPECDADAVSWSSAEVWNGQRQVDRRTLRAQLDRREIADQIEIVKAHRDGDSDRFSPSKIDEAYVTLLSLRELGIIGHDNDDEE
ncbi:hypothetical protein [Halorubrum halophilum]|uniref:hypothetical protein n=1 Tax=Halorubrum halophilum TaxID=413816 RepID=UPI000678F308|nr:hypothetical protein [Halorubrum halophilum]